MPLKSQTFSPNLNVNDWWIIGTCTDHSPINGRPYRELRLPQYFTKFTITGMVEIPDAGQSYIIEAKQQDEDYSKKNWEMIYLKRDSYQVVKIEIIKKLKMFTAYYGLTDRVPFTDKRYTIVVPNFPIVVNSSKKQPLLSLKDIQFDEPILRESRSKKIPCAAISCKQIVSVVTRDGVIPFLADSLRAQIELPEGKYFQILIVEESNGTAGHVFKQIWHPDFPWALYEEHTWMNKQTGELSERPRLKKWLVDCSMFH